MHADTRIIIFAKAPLPGFAKTRLIPALGASGAAKLARHLFDHAIDQALAARLGTVELCVTPDKDQPCWQSLELPEDLIISSQGEGDLGERMAKAAERALAAHSSVLLIGTDCPGLSAETMAKAAALLHQHDGCLVPVSDGGYALLGLRCFHPSLFSTIPWSTPQVAQHTRERFQALNWSLVELGELHDIDEADDLKYLPDGFV